MDSDLITKIAIFTVIMCSFYYVINSRATPRPYPYYPQKQGGNVVIQQPTNQQLPQQQPSYPSVDGVYDAIHKFDTAKIIDPLQDPITRNSLLNYGLPYDSYRQVGTLKCIYEDPPLTKRELYEERNNYFDDEYTYNGVEKALPQTVTSHSPPVPQMESSPTVITDRKKKCRKCKDKKVKVENFISGQYNDILPLYGMQSNINTNIWFYYTTISDGNNTIKIMLNPPNNGGTTELWTGSVIYIPELNKTYEAIVNQTIFMTYG